MEAEIIDGFGYSYLLVWKVGLMNIIDKGRKSLSVIDNRVKIFQGGE